MAARADNAFFRQLIEPLDVATFIADVWERRSRFLPGFGGRFAGLDVGFERFANALGRLPPDRLRANRIAPDGSGIYLPVEAADCKRRFQEGMTICASDLHLCLPRLLQLAQDTRRAMGLAGAVCVNAYLSPADSGFGLHFDKQSVFITCKSRARSDGATDAEPRSRFRLKAWTPFLTSVETNFVTAIPASRADPDATEWGQCALRPGDALSAARGLAPGTAGDYSLALTLTCCTRDFASLLLPALQRSLFMREGWRRNLPVRPQGDGEAHGDQLIEERVSELQQLGRNVGERGPRARLARGAA